MHHLIKPKLHVVAEIVEAELVIGAVCYIRRVSFPTLLIG